MIIFQNHLKGTSSSEIRMFIINYVGTLKVFGFLGSRHC